ncbi:MAG TPA: protein kinase [Candidatus Angelobacter sp.]|nr:protein kinase [Candidatus Angelobacter sp.]
MNPHDARKISDAPTIAGPTTPGGAGAAASPAPIDPTAILTVGQVIGGRFQIMEMLGIGGMGAVYKAYDRDIERIIALKCIRPELVSNREVVQRFTQELLLARQISHKNIVRIFDVRDSGGLKFITMEYIEGRDLGSVMEERGKLPPAEAVGIMRQVCAGLSAAHAEGIVHRDLKPSNVMLEATGRVVVMDFGLARDESRDLMTKTGAIMGTYEYMSPEQARGEKVDARSDIFTVGVILYELLTGQSPYASDSQIASLLKRTTQAAIPPSSIDASISRPLNAIVCKCLERDLARRYQSADDLIADLDAVTVGRTASRLPSVLAKQDRAKWVFVFSAAVLALIVGVSAAIRWFGGGHTSAPPAHAAVKVLLADFKNETADSVFDGTLESSFGLAMEGAPFISAYNRTTAHKIMARIKPDAPGMDESNASLVAVREGVNVVISGAVKREGDGYRLSCRAVDPVNQKVLGTSETSTVSKDKVLQAVADLAGRMRTVLGDTTPESLVREQEETVTSSSLEAVHEYAIAQDLQFAGKWQPAQEHYSNSIKLDQQMGRAYSGMAVMFANLNRNADAEPYFKQAMAHIDRMTDREKYRTRGAYYLMTRQPDKAIQEYEALVKQYPADGVAASNLAYAAFISRDMQKAVQGGRHAVELSPQAVLQRTNLALYLVYAGDYAAGAKVAQEALQLSPGSEDAMGALAMAQLGQGDLPAATATYQKLQSMSPRGASMANLGLADLAMYQGRDADAVPLLEKGIAADIAAKDSASAGTKSIALAQAYLSQGQKAKALATADQALKLSPGHSIAFAAGEIYVAAGELPKAVKLAAPLSSRIEPEPQIYGQLLQGAIELKRNQVKDAIQSFEKAQKISNTWLGHLYLGKAYLQNESFTEADSEFDVCLKRRGEMSAVFLDDAPTFRLFPPLYYYIGRAHEGLNSPEAKDNYRTFLSMQPKGTGELISDVRRRLEAR